MLNPRAITSGSIGFVEPTITGIGDPGLFQYGGDTAGVFRLGDVSGEPSFSFEGVEDLPEFVPLRGELIRRDLHVQIRRNRTPGADTENRTAVIINTADPDRHGTIIDPAGARLDEYRANPVVLVNHDHNLLAAVSSIQTDGGKIVAHLNDDDWDHDDPLVERWFRKLKKGLLSTASIGAIVHDYVVELIDPDGDAEDWDNRRIRITDWSLAEWSFVSVPSNPGAVVTARMMQDRERGSVAGVLPTAPPIESEPEPESDPEPEPEPVREAVEDVPAIVAPMRRQATPEEYAAVVRGVLPVIRSEIERITGKR